MPMNANGWTVFYRNGRPLKKLAVENNRPKLESEVAKLVRRGYTIQDFRWFGKTIDAKTALAILNVANRMAALPPDNLVTMPAP